MIKSNQMIVIIGVLVICILFLSNVESEFCHFHFNYKEDDSLHPETQSDLDAPAQERYIEAEYTEVAGIRTNKQDVLIGRFESESRERDMNFTFDLINTWFRIIQEPGQNAEPHFQYNFYVDDVRRYGHGVGFPDHGHDDIIEFISDSDATLNIAWDSIFWVEVFYSGYEDIVVYLDNASYDSGFQGRADILYLLELKAIGKLITLEVFDIFHTDWNEVIPYIKIKVDDELILNLSGSVKKESQWEINETIINSTIIKWILDEKLNEGQSIRILVKYTMADPDEEKGLTITGFADEDDENGLFISGFELTMIIGSIGVTIMMNDKKKTK